MTVKESIVLVLSMVFMLKVHAQDGNMTGIDAFYAEDGYFDDLSEALKDLESVIYLDLSLRSPKLRAIPSEVFKLANLRYLELGFNQIALVDSSIAYLKELEVIGLDGNKYLKTTPIIPPSLTNLKEIHVKDTGLSSAQIEELKRQVPAGCTVYQ